MKSLEEQGNVIALEDGRPVVRRGDVTPAEAGGRRPHRDPGRTGLRAGHPIPNKSSQEKIAVWIIGCEPSPEEIIQPILWGLEEEGIPADFRQAPDEGAESLAKRAADGSPLNVGIGISGTEQAVALHHRDLPRGMPLFLLTAAKLQPHELRRLGANAARLVKGDPLDLHDESTLRQDFTPTTELSQNELEQIVALVLANILSNKNG